MDISRALFDYRLSGLYSMAEGILLRLQHETLPDAMVAISAEAIWRTMKNLSSSQADPFVALLRDRIERCKLISADQVAHERIVRLVLENREKERLSLFAELFGRGNIILTRPLKEEDDYCKIECVWHPQSFRHRKLEPGESYSLPPARGIPLEHVTPDGLKVKLGERDRGTEASQSKVDLVRWLGRSIATSKKFIEEILFRAEVDPKMALAKVGDIQLGRVAAATNELLRDIEKSRRGFVLISATNYSTSTAQSGNVEPDVCSVVPNSWKQLEQGGAAQIREFKSLHDAIDEAYASAIINRRKTAASEELRSKQAELESAIRTQDSLLEQNGVRSNSLRALAQNLMTSESEGVDAQLGDRLRTLGVVIEVDVPQAAYRFKTEPRSYLSSFNPKSLASRLYGEAKLLEERNSKIAEVRASLLKQKNRLLERGMASEERAGRRIVVDRRARQWFERYRWFFTSDRRLAVGGRDSTTNSIVINKYTKPHDAVFHADLHGSPFFVLKNPINADSAVSNEDETEASITTQVAQATVSFSRAWRDELGSADAYWVFPAQLKKSAPSGEYLPRGSFFIEGKKNFVRHLKIELAIGLTLEEVLHSEDAEGEFKKNSRAGSADSNSPPHSRVVIVCGPEKALVDYSISLVRITHGKEKGSAIARRIKQLLVARTKDPTLADAAKKIPIDDVVRVLPSGTYKIISDRQKC